MHRILSYRSLLAAAAIALAPFALNAQAATVACKDGTTSTAKGRGACSGHGGVDKSSAKAAKSDAKAAKSDAKASTRAAKAESKEAKADTKSDVKAATKSSKAAEKATSKAVSSDVKETGKTANVTAANTDPTNATAKCKDGTYSHAATHRGACSRHGGVSEWLKS